MAADPPGEPARSSGLNGRVDRGWPEPAGPPGTPVIDATFDSGRLSTLRVQLQACAVQAGLGEDRVADVILAVHELAANAVRHGGGAGRLRVWDQAAALYCQVDDGYMQRTAEPEAAPDHAAMSSLPCQPGHGLWVVRQVADRMRSLSGPRGTSVMIAFEHGR